MEYFLHDEIIVRVETFSDGTTREWSIPKDEKNADYKEYLAWAAVKGNKAQQYPTK